MTLPKFITARMVEDVADQILALTWQWGWNQDGVMNCHIVVLVPVKENGRVVPHPILDKSYGKKIDWKYPLDQIARSKASQLYYGQNDGRTDIQPHLLFPGDTVYWGGDKLERFVTALSGYECWQDKALSRMNNAALIARVNDAFQASKEKKHNLNFLV